MLDKNISWVEYIRTVETKLAKNIGLLYRAKPLLEEKSIKSIYFAYIHSYLNYANIAWASTYRTKLKTIHFYQKHAVRIVFNEDKIILSRPLLRSLNALNIYQINLYQHLAFMYKLNKNKAPLGVTKSMVKLLLFRCRVTNSKLRNIKLHLKLLTGKPKKRKKNLCSSRIIVIRDFFIEMVYYAIQNI